MGDTKEICKGCKKEKELSASKPVRSAVRKNRESHNKNKEKNNERRMNHYWNNREHLEHASRSIGKKSTQRQGKDAQRIMKKNTLKLNG